MRVLVAGGGGFVGGAITSALRQAGCDATAIARRAAPGIVALNAADPAQAAAAAQGADAVVNAILADGRTMRSTTRNLAEAAFRRRIPLIHVSSAAVYGPAIGRIAETAPLLGADGYAAAKRECEALVRASRARFTILRPGIVYGPGSSQWVAKIGGMLRAGRLGDLGPAGDGRCNLVLAADLAGAVVSLLEHNAGWGEAINLGVPAPPRWNAFFALLARAIGAAPLARIGAARLRFEAFAAPLLAAGRSFGLPPAIPSGLQRLFRQDLVLDTSRAQGLGFPATDLPGGIASSAAWFRELPA